MNAVLFLVNVDGNKTETSVFLFPYVIICKVGVIGGLYNG
jgi:hypothetical protein